MFSAIVGSAPSECRKMISMSSGVADLVPWVEDDLCLPAVASRLSQRVAAPGHLLYACANG
jgi:hypothetical protein